VKSDTFHRHSCREAVHDISRECAKFVASYDGSQSGLLHVLAPHATARLAMLEPAAEPDQDLLAAGASTCVVPPGLLSLAELVRVRRTALRSGCGMSGGQESDGGRWAPGEVLNSLMRNAMGESAGSEMTSVTPRCSS